MKLINQSENSVKLSHIIVEGLPVPQRSFKPVVFANLFHQERRFFSPMYQDSPYFLLSFGVSTRRFGEKKHSRARRKREKENTTWGQLGNRMGAKKLCGRDRPTGRFHSRDQ